MTFSNSVVWCLPTKSQKLSAGTSSKQAASLDSGSKSLKDALSSNKVTRVCCGWGSTTQHLHHLPGMGGAPCSVSTVLNKWVNAHVGRGVCVCECAHVCVCVCVCVCVSQRKPSAVTLVCCLFCSLTGGELSR